MLSKRKRSAGSARSGRALIARAGTSLLTKSTSILPTVQQPKTTRYFFSS